MVKRLNQETWALIPARAGSKGIANKNLQEVDGVSLLGLAVTSAVHCEQISRVFVSTDDDAYAQEARRYGAETPYLRPKHLSSDTSTDTDVFLHFLEWALASNLDLPWAIAHLRPTTPARRSTMLTGAIQAAAENGSNMTSLRSAHRSAESPFKWFLKDPDGFALTLLGTRELDAANRSRSEYPSAFIPNGYIDVLFPEKILASRELHGERVLIFETEEVLEIDTEFQLKLLRASETLPKELVTQAWACRKW